MSCHSLVALVLTPILYHGLVHTFPHPCGFQHVDAEGDVTTIKSQAHLDAVLALAQPPEPLLITVHPLAAPSGVWCRLPHPPNSARDGRTPCASLSVCGEGG